MALPGNHFGTKDSDIDLEFPGSDVEITTHNIFKARFFCFENLTDFPINQNTCEFSVYMSGSVAAWNITDYAHEVKFILPEGIKTAPKKLYM